MATAYSNPEDFKRLRRREVAGQARAINFHCFQGRPLLTSDRACGWFVECAERQLAKHQIDLWAYCLMPNHVHLVLYPRGAAPNVGAFLESIKKGVVRRAITYLEQQAPEGLALLEDPRPDGTMRHRFWQRGGGYDRNLFTAKAVWGMIDYAHANPVEAGLCARAEDWKWSSAGAYAGNGQGALTLGLDSLPQRPG